MYTVRALSHGFTSQFKNLDHLLQWFKIGDQPRPRPTGTKYRVNGPDFAVIVTYK